MNDYIKIQCECGRVIKVPVEDKVFQFAGRPQTLGGENCPVCNRRVVAYILINQHEESAGTHEGVVYVD